MNTLALFFEVLDKEPSIQSIWLTFLPVAIAGYLLCRLRWWLIALVLPVALLFSLVWLTELLDSYIGPAMWRESRSYVIQSYAAMLIELLFPCVGAFLQWDKRKSHSDSSSFLAG
ncbi:MAG: hypothetical protein H0W76_16365 [Pyrinomonadaceae bacterium]|nr:hypothetical protein [Pyrinomonadaceae bacterium]